MKEYRFPPLSRFAVLITLGIIVVVAVVCVSVYFVYEDVGGYITASVAGILLAWIVLECFSMPRKVRVGEGRVEIVCNFETVSIPSCDIVSLRKITADERRKYLPVWGSYGFFGFSGCFFYEKTVRLYATSLSSLIEIKTAKRTYVISAADADTLIKIIKELEKQSIIKE